MGAPYALSSDLVSAWPAKSLEVAQYIDEDLPLIAMPQNAQTGTTYTLAATDFTKLVTLSNASPVAVTLPLEATVPWPAYTQLRLLNQGAGLVTVAGAVGVTINGTPLTLAQYKGANLIKTGTNTWTFIPFASGVGAAVYSDANTGTYTGYAYKTYTASGTLTITTAGFADIYLVGGGGAGGYNVGGGGGGGGVVAITNAYLPAGPLTVTIGAGGSASGNTPNSGLPSRIGSYFAPGSGAGGGTSSLNGDNGKNGASGGGGQKTSGTGGSGDAGTTIGNNGGTGSASTAGGGGGGGSAVGAVGSGTTGGAGGAGTGTTIAGTTPTGAYVAGTFTAGGGGGGGGTGSAGAAGAGGGGAGATAGAGTAGTANTGGGGGGTAAAASLGGNGGSGIVIVRVAV